MLSGTSKLLKVSRRRLIRGTPSTVPSQRANSPVAPWRRLSPTMDGTPPGVTGRFASIITRRHSCILSSTVSNDPEVYQLYRRIVDNRPDIVAAYASAITALVERILAECVAKGLYSLDDTAAAAGVVRDAMMVFVHPALVAAAVIAGQPTEDQIRNVMATLHAGFSAGVQLAK